MTERVILLGTGSLAHKLAAELAGSCVLLGVINEAPEAVPAGFGCPCLGSLEDLQRIIEEQAPDRVVVAMQEQYGHLPAEKLVESQAGRALVVESGVDAYERLTGMLAIELLTMSAVVYSSEFRPARLALWLARAYSVLAAGVGFVLCLPLMLLVALAIRIESPGPVLFVQERVGLGGRRFKLLKFRSMREAAGAHSEWEGDNADRITRVGRLLRKFRLDELPQFVNVLRGDMNIVGPRPHPVSNRELFILVSRNTPKCGEPIPYYTLRSSIRPGITGWAQVRYKYANGLDEEMEKLRYDLYYIKHYSLLMDLRILFETVKVVLLGHRQPPRAAIQPTPGPAEPVGGEPVLPGLAAALQEARIRHPRLPERRHAPRERSLGQDGLSRAP